MKTIEWTGEELVLLDQTQLPNNILYKRCIDWREVAEAIKMLRVRGAPAIGVAAGYGLILAAREAAVISKSKEEFLDSFHKFAKQLGETRPTAVNLLWAIGLIKEQVDINKTKEISEIISLIEEKAIFIEKEDIALCEAIGKAGLTLFNENKKYNILTHCNTGALATAGIGTALGVIRKLHQVNKIERVYADETRPLLQGSRLTAFELMQNNIPSTLLTDNMAAFAMQQGLIDAVIVGADRITTNGDVANKIGTYGVAVLAKAHNIPFYVAAPFSTFDFNMKEGKEIPIEQRSQEEVLTLYGIKTAPENMEVLNPAFDVTPHELINGIITEEGAITGNLAEGIAILKEKIKNRA